MNLWSAKIQLFLLIQQYCEYFICTILSVTWGLFDKSRFMFRHRIFNHDNVYFAGLILLGICLPLSKFGMSVAIFILLGNWILEGDFKRKLKILQHRKSILIFIALILVHILWLMNTSDFQYAFKDIRIKSPLLALPLIMGTSRSLTSGQLKTIILFFVGGVTAGSLVSSYVLLGYSGQVIDDIRDISIFISHIRFSLLINIAIFSLGYLMYAFRDQNKKIETIAYSILLVWLVSFIFILQSLTGILIFLIVGFVLSLILTRRLSNFMLKYFLMIVLVTIPLIIAAYVSRGIVQFYRIDKPDPGNIARFTANSNPYEHNFENKQVENGHYIWMYVCEKELEKEWNARSRYEYTGLDDRSQHLKYTLIRYLTSRGFRKDSVGISHLTDEDVRYIEQGITNYRYWHGSGLEYMLYQLIWQIDVYRKGGNPSGHSVTQRIEYLRTAFQIIGDHFFFGVGTGDLQNAFDEKYNENDSLLSDRWRLRAHNQYVTFFITFGLIGFLICMVTIIAPVFYENKQNDYWFMMFFIIALLSMLNEDTVETHAGATFFAYFYSLFLFARDNKWF